MAATSETMPQEINDNEWLNVPISNIEDLSDAVLGAGLEATQIDSRAVRGSLCFNEGPDFLFSSGHLQGRVRLQGSLSESLITLGIALDVENGSRHWLKEISTGTLGAFMPGDEHDAMYMPGSLYAAFSLSEETLESKAAELGLVLNRKSLGGTGIHPCQAPRQIVERMAARIRMRHEGIDNGDANAHRDLLDILLVNYAREPRPIAPPNPQGLAKIVQRARSYIEAHLEQKLSVGEIAVACNTSQRTLTRAFGSILGETPYAYVNRMRLNHIRHDLVCSRADDNTITTIAHRWGFPELGRMSENYRSMFGECPSVTLARAPSRVQ